MARIEVSTGRGFTLAGVAYGKATMSSLGNRRRIGPKDATPKSYREVGGFVCPEFAHGWQSGCVKVYAVKDEYRCSFYLDGCFNPYYAKIEFHN